MRILHSNLHFTMPNLRYVLGDLGTANPIQIIFDELLRTIVGFGRRMQEGVTTNRQVAVD